MAPVYKVKQGDCISSIALHFGHFWETLWNEPDNTGLWEFRKDPNVLMAGDEVMVPEIRPKAETGATEVCHRFRKKGVPAKLRLRVLMEDPFEEQEDKEEPKSRANQEYVLDLDGAIYRGTTDDDGIIEVAIPPNARYGKLTVGPDNTVIKVALGELDPVDQISGLQGRLNNLGFHCGAVTGEINEATQAALRRFQEEHGLEVTGQPDQQTRDKLEEAHGS
ncbi:PGRP and LysM peptidoglycan-binding domain-containing protein [Desulfosarcina ovata]|uniref:Peptidoglycan binding-like domain-containing protein n=1 Tax=Desulfosarcina ovata subsp. ovata TaxID=2752305 RepID=A0A5K8A8S9_9BACT|nr:peptidoglycan-binding protein [Desulfosarcina ovata]BBO88744.1 hypothetical protein DSCOOX_19240 [Desulfosarcina ovata subsp. ovata]